MADVVWMLAVFAQSLLGGTVSGGQSSQLAQTVQQVGGFSTQNTLMVEKILRKLAHLAEFFVLGCLVVLTLWLFARWEKTWLALGALVGIPVGLMDETLQLIPAGRYSCVTDVWLDWAGYLLGFAVLGLVLHLHSKRRKET